MNLFLAFLLLTSHICIIKKTTRNKKIMNRIHLHIALLCLSSDRLSYDYEQEQDWIIWDANMT